MALLETLTDDFSAGTLDTTKWTNITTGDSVAFINSGVLQLSCGNTGVPGVRSKDNYTLGAASSLVAKVVYPPGGFHSVRIFVKCATGTGESQITIYNNTLYFFNSTTGQVGGGLAYNSTTHAWLRMRFAVTGTSVTTYYDTSPDGKVWTQRAAGTAQTWNSINCYAQFVVEDGTLVNTTIDNVNPYAATAAPASLADVDTVGGPSLALVAVPPLETLTETFGTGALDTAKWTDISTAGNTAVVSAGVLSVTTNGTGSAGVRSALTYTLGQLSQTSAKVVVAGGAFAFTRVRVAEVTGGAYSQFYIQGSTAFMQWSNTTGTASSSSFSYSASTHAWLRMRFDVIGATVVTYFDTSPDNLTWTQRGTTTQTWAGTGCQVILDVLTNADTAARTATFDNININAPKTVADLADDFSGGVLDTTKWVQSSGTYAVTPEGLIWFKAASTASGSTSQINSALDYFSFYGGAVYCRVTPNKTINASAILKVTNGQGNGLAQLEIRPGTAPAVNLWQTVYSNTNSKLRDVSTPFDPSWLYLRIRMDDTGSTIFFDRSVDGINWVTLGSASTPGWGRSARVVLSVYHAASTSLTPVYFDAVNTTATSFIDTCIDNFQAATLDPKWTTSASGGGAVTVAGDSYAVLTTSAGNTTSSAQIASTRNTYVAGGGTVTACLTPSPTPGVSTLLRMTNTAGTSTLNYGLVGTNLVYFYDTNAPTVIGPYDPDLMRYWRIDTTPTGTVTLQYGQGDTTYTTAATPAPLWTTTAGFSLLVRNEGVAVSGTTRLDAFNTLGAIGILTAIADAETFDPPVVVTPVSDLADDFLGTTLDAKWIANTTGGSTVAVAGSMLQLTTGTGSTTALAEVQSSASVNMLGAAVYARVIPAPNGTVWTTLRVNNVVGNGYAMMRLENASLRCQAFNSANTSVANTLKTYDPVTYAYWRIRMDAAGIAYFERSADAATWTTDVTSPALGWGDVTRVVVHCTNSTTAVAATGFIDAILTAPTGVVDAVTDDFLAPLDTTKWTPGTSGGGTVTSTGDSWVTLTTSAADPLSSAQITTARSDLMFTGSWVTAACVEPSTNASVGTYLQVFDGAGNAITMGKIGTLLVWFLNTNAPTTIATYSATTHKYWRISVSQSGATKLQYSSDGITWSGTTTATVAWGAAVSARFYVQNAASVTGSSRVDAINMLGARTPVGGITEDFPGSTLDTTKWQDTSTTGTVTVGAGLLNLTLATTAINDTAEVKTVGQLCALVDSAIYARVVPSTAANTETALYVTNSGGAFGYAAFRFVGTTVFRTMYNNANSAIVNQSTAAYIPADWAYVRIRMDATGANIYFDRSPDAITWTQVSTAGAPGWGSSVEVRLSLKNTTATVTGTRTGSFDTINLIAPAPPIVPTGIADAEALGAPTAGAIYPVVPDGIAESEAPGSPALSLTATVHPGGVTDPETVGSPAVDFQTLAATPDTIADPETLDGPQASFRVTGINPDSVTDAETFGAPDVTLMPQLEPDGIAETETLGEPTVPLMITGGPDSLTDDETLDDIYVGFQASEIDPAGITDPETFGAALLFFYPSEINPAGIADPLTVGDPSADFISHYTGAYSTGVYGAGPYSGIAFEPHGIVDLDVVGRPSLTDPTVVPPDTIIVAGITDAETFGQPSGSLPNPTNLLYGMGTYSEGPYWGSGPPPTDGDTVPNLNYGFGTYGYGIYYGTVAWEPAQPLFPEAAKSAPPLHILGIGPWSSRIDWRGAPNYTVRGGHQPARPAMPLPPATGKGFTLRLGDGSEARCELAFSRDSALIIDEMDTDLWWRRKDPRTGKLEMIGRFNTAHVNLSTTDTGISCSVQFVDYQTVLGERMVLDYLDRAHSESQWAAGTPVTKILAWALPKNTPLDLSDVTGSKPYDLGKTTEPFHLPPDTNMNDLMDNLNAISPKHWEWWVETPLDIHQPPKLRFVTGERGRNRGVTLFDVGSGPTPIAQWTRNAASDEYANALYYTGGDPKAGLGAGGGVILSFPDQIDQYGQRDALYGNSSVDGGNKELLRQRASRKLETLADRRASYTVRLAQGFWRGREHIDVGDLVGLRLRMGEDFLHEKFRVSELTVDIDDNGLEEVTLALGRLATSADPRSKRSPIARVMRYLKNYVAPNGAADITTPDD